MTRTPHRSPAYLLSAIVALLAVLALAAAASAAAPPAAVLSLRTVSVGAPGNPAVGIVPFTDAVYRSCPEAPPPSGPRAPSCQSVGAVDHRYQIGELEVTVAQWVAFLNTVDPAGRNRHRLYSPDESSSAWPKYGQIDFSPRARPGRHYSVASPEWANKPYAFANFLRAARFVNSVQNGRVLSRRVSLRGGIRRVTYRVRLSRRTGDGMYEMRRQKTTRRSATGFVVPSQDEWIKAAYYDPDGGGTYSYWKYPTNPGAFGDGSATAPAQSVLDPADGSVLNGATQPLSTYHAPGEPAAPAWCPGAQGAEACASVNPLGLSAGAYAKAYQGNVSAVGQARTRSPWGTLDQGGNAVEWTDTITPPPFGAKGARVWRRLHGGIANAPAYQLWLSAVGLQPQDNSFFTATYPWLGLRIGAIGDPRRAPVRGSSAAASARSPKARSRGQSGSLVQLRGERGCLADGSRKAERCGAARALKGPGPFMGSQAIAISPDGRHVYVAASRSDAIAVFSRHRRSGVLTQADGAAGCVAARGREGCGRALGLDGPNSVAVSPDGRFVYASARASNAVTSFRRDRRSGALTQLRGPAGCVSGLPVPGCAAGRALLGPDVVGVSPDGENLYAGSFFGNAVAIFKRARNGVLYQATDSTGCIAEAIAGCAPAIALGAPEGLAVSPDGASVYVAGAASNAVAELQRDPASGALSQPAPGAGACIASPPLAGCATGVQLGGANAVAIAPAGRDVYVTSLLSNGVASFSRSAAGLLTPKPATHACLVYLRSAGCSFGRAMAAPEGLALSPDGRNVYVAAFRSGAIDVLRRDRESGVVFQLPGAAGCLAPRSLPGCTPGRALRGVSSIAVSPDGHHVYATAFASNAVDVFRRNR